ncbi:hypothetical protein [Pareuzebyella sediminis]|uniref:hypothetical protein n=1 Tax=Pareuzebyella sediminis TaxID=2607998 RepID=UPI0011EFD68E|nr:hypothetical protein [Pareuzebyella sediminis]
MKLTYRIFICAIFFGFLSSFKPNQACQYAESNMGYVKSETEKAIGEIDIQLTRFHTYKAINAIEKTKSQLNECGCEQAVEIITESSEQLKMAAKAVTLAATQMLLEKAKQSIIESITLLKEHDGHQSFFGNDVLNINTTDIQGLTPRKPSTEAFAHQKIDSSLAHYKVSLDKVIANVNCKQAKAFANRIYNQCEQELLKPNLSENKKYYNLKTKEITAAAIEKLGQCER